MALTIDQLARVQTIYVHDHCPDGLASAMILRDAFNMLHMSPPIRFISHGTPDHMKAGTGGGGDEWSLFCDIAPHAGVAALLAKGRKTIVLDHHVGVRELVESFGDLGVYADAERDRGVSGAVLAHLEVWQPLNRDTGCYDFLGNVATCVGAFARAVGARDTWCTDNPAFMQGQWISKLLMSKPAKYWLEHGPMIDAEEIAGGRALFEAHEHAVKQACEQCVYYVVPNELGAQQRAGQSVCVAVFQEQASGFRLTSDVAEALRAENTIRHEAEADFVPVDVVAGFAYVVDEPGGDPKLVVSLRGLGGYDVCALAKTMGGGGHRAAAGFSVLYGEVATASATGCPYGLVRTVVRDHVWGTEYVLGVSR